MSKDDLRLPDPEVTDSKDTQLIVGAINALTMQAAELVRAVGDSAPDRPRLIEESMSDTQARSVAAFLACRHDAGIGY